jgi:CelD/BcsL family acetyltransferase involved in cellulose biosynthesis
VSLDHPGPRAFIERLTAHAADAGWLSLWLIELDGRPAAMEYQILYAGRVHALRGDFDPEFDSLSPGTYLHHHQLRALFEEPGMDTYLMGQGANPYKLRWSSEGLTLQGLRAWSPTPSGRLLRAWERRIRPMARGALERLRPRTPEEPR